MNNVPYVDYNQEIKVATDAVCIVTEGNEFENDEKYILLIKREYEPFKNHWAIPGGFLKNNEELPDCALRELSEETNIDTSNLEPIEIGTFGKIGRDPRKRIISVAFLIKLENRSEVRKANETLEVKWIKLKDLSEYKLAFDHKDIIDKALNLL